MTLLVSTRTAAMEPRMSPCMLRLGLRALVSSAAGRPISRQIPRNTRSLSSILSLKPPPNLLMSTPPIPSSFGGDSPLSEAPLSEEDFAIPLEKPKRKRKARVSGPYNGVQALDGVSDVAVTPPARKRRKKTSTSTTEVVSIEETTRHDEVNATPSSRRRSTRARKTTVSQDVDETVEGGLESEISPSKKKRRKTPEEDREYVIAPIEQILPTNFHGRLGYACMNTILRKRKPSVFCARTCRIDTIKKEGLQYVMELGRQNVIDLLELIRWNEANNIKFMRMSSEMFPFASHKEYGYSLEFAEQELKAVGELAKEYGHRLTTHPGQFTQLGSPRDEVVEASFRDLTYHCDMIDRMGLGSDSIMIIHMGGVFGDKEGTKARFRENYAKLSPNIKARLVLENDELCYNVDDLLPLCIELEIPLVFDYHHDWIYPSSKPPAELIPLINDVWIRKGIKPKQHCSEPRPGAVTVMEKRAHSDRISKLPDNCPDDMDLMLECKDKEQACLHLYRLYNLFEVNPRVLRPPAEVETLHTQGRKSNKKKKKVADEGIADDPEDEENAPMFVEDAENMLNGGESQDTVAVEDGVGVMSLIAENPADNQDYATIGAVKDLDAVQPVSKKRRSKKAKKGTAGGTGNGIAAAKQ